MKIKLIIIIFPFLFLTTCKSQSISEIDLVLIKEYVFDIKNNDNFPISPAIIIENKKQYLTLLNDDNKVIYKYDISSTLMVDSIPIKILPYNQIWSTYYHTKDSIFVIYNAAKNKDYNHSGTVLLINSKGNLINSYSLKGLPINCSECGNVKAENLEYISMKYDNLLFGDNKLYIQMECYNYNPGDENYSKIFHPVSASIDVKTNEIKIHPIKIPAKINFLYPKRNEVISVCLSKTNSPIIGFNHTSSVVEYNNITNKSIYHKIKTVFGDTVFANNELPKKQDDYNQNSFENIYYNKFKNYYLRIIRLALPKEASSESKRNPPYGITIFNEKFEVIGESVLSEGLSPICYFTQDGICFWNKAKTKKMNTNLIYFNEYKINFNSSTKEKIISDIPEAKLQNKELGLKEYIDNSFKKPNGKFVVIFIPISEACLSCINYATLFVSKNQFDKPIYIILAADNNGKINNFLVPYDFKDKNKIWYDSTANYKNYLDPSVLYGSAILYDNEKIIKEIKLIPESLKVAELEINSFLGK